MFYSYELIKKEGYSTPWQFVDQFKKTFPNLYEGSEVNHEEVEIIFKNRSTIKTEKKKEKIINAKIFDQPGQTYDLTDFIKENKITREQIISIDFAIDPDAPRRIGKYSTAQILIVWEEER